jgi:hypothetical protein
MPGPSYNFDANGTRRIVATVKRSEATPLFPAQASVPLAPGDAVIQAFQVTSLPGASNGATPAYVVGSPYWWNGSAGTVAPQNYSIATIAAHNVGDVIHALPINSTKTGLKDAAGLAVLWQEINPSGVVWVPASLLQVGGSAGDANTPCSYTYVLYNKVTGLSIGIGAYPVEWIGLLRFVRQSASVSG